MRADGRTTEGVFCDKFKFQVFWMGDLNYRVDQPFEQTLRVLKVGASHDPPSPPPLPHQMCLHTRCVTAHSTPPIHNAMPQYLSTAYTQ